MKTLTKQITITIEYDYVIFNGENFDEVKDFVKNYNLYGNSDIDESFHIRPTDIPNLDEDELLKWWLSTGSDTDIHNYNNMPIWYKDELLMIDFEDGYYINREMLKKDCAIICINRNPYVIYQPTEEKIDEFVNDFLQKRIEQIEN